jgi:hypothetical protein
MTKERKIYEVHVSKRVNGVQKHKRIKVRAGSPEAAQRAAEDAANSTKYGEWK